jgi:hypothetical protein
MSNQPPGLETQKTDGKVSSSVGSMYIQHVKKSMPSLPVAVIAFPSPRLKTSSRSEKITASYYWDRC